MRQEYLIDGYNLIRSRPVGQLRRAPGNLQKERYSLVRWIGTRLDENSTATVVFDASSPLALLAPNSEETQFGITVLFAKEYDTADEMIQEICRRHTHPKQLTVVSDDNLVRKVALRRRAQVLKCDAFMAHLAASARKSLLPPPKPEKPVQPTPQERETLAQIFDLGPRDLPSHPDDMADFYRTMRQMDAKRTDLHKKKSR